MKALDGGLGMKTRVSSQKAPAFVAPTLLAERASSARRRDDPVSVYFKSPAKQASRLGTNDERSGLNESRSLLARMKDEFRNSTNNSLSGIHQKESRVHNQSSENILIRSIMIKPKLSLLEQPFEEKNINLENLKSEFYNKLSKQRKEMARGGTLENLFSILNKEARLSREGKDNMSLISRSRHIDLHQLSASESKLREHRFSGSTETPKQMADVRSNHESVSPFPSDKIQELIKSLETIKISQIGPSERNELVLLRAQIKKLINS
jgi:hypothetical protein